MRRALIAVLASGLVLAAAVTGQAKAPSSLKVTLTVTSNNVVHDGHASPVTPATTYSPGDTTSFTADILRGGGHKVGREDSTCGMTTSLIQLCTLVDHLPGGTIVHVGANSIVKETFADAITGGTGIYAAAHGSVVGKFTGVTSLSQTYQLR
jgi:hypothetical protein